MYLKKKRMYSLCAVPTDWLNQYNGIKPKITTHRCSNQEVNFFLSSKTTMYLQMHAHAVFQLIQKVVKLDIQSNSSV